MHNKIIEANWQAPENIVAFTTTRLGGVSAKPYDSFNLAKHCGDEHDNVVQNRSLLAAQHGLPSEPYWLNQVHGNTVITADHDHKIYDADASYSQQPDVVCAVLTADCLPILVCNQEGNEIAAIHAGWRSLANGVIENTIANFQSKHLLAWLGPCISKDAYEIGTEVFQHFTSQSTEAELAFTATRKNHWLADLPLLATQRLQSLGVNDISYSQLCTLQQDDLFYSYRRDGNTGRMASLIYFSNHPSSK